jgi:DNA gyrase subunit A
MEETGTHEAPAEGASVSETTLVILSAGGFLKRVPLSEFETQKRGGKGIVGGKPREEDMICGLGVAAPGDRVFFFTNAGKCHSVETQEIPAMGRYARGKKVGGLLELAPDENVTFILTHGGEVGEEPILLISARGIVKRTSLSNFRKQKRGGTMAMTLGQGDAVRSGYVSTAPAGALILTAMGKVVNFDESGVRVMGKSAQGVRGVKLSPDDSVVAVCPAREGLNLLVVTQKGFGKLTGYDQFRKTSRGAGGVAGARLTEKTGKVAFGATVSTGEIVLSSKHGKFIRFRATDVRETGRAAVGVRLMRLDDDDAVAAGVVV